MLDTTGPNTLNREHVQRRIVVFCNVQGRDLASVVSDIRQRVAPIENRLRTLPGNYHIEFGGQFEAQQQANFRLMVLGTVSVIGIFLLLVQCLESWQAAPASPGQYSIGGDGIDYHVIDCEPSNCRSVTSCSVVGVASRLEQRNDVIGCTLGRLYHFDWNRQPQWDHDGVALHPLDATRGRAVR